MFSNSFIANLIIFMLGQVAAWGYLRTGLVRRGVVLLTLTWCFADIALVARFAFADPFTGLAPEPVYGLSILAMQLYSLIELALFVSGRVRRRLPSVLERRKQLFREAFVLYLKDDLQPAIDIFRRLARVDPWDLPVRFAYATALSRSGARNRARRMFQSIRALDHGRRYRDAIDAELMRKAESGGPQSRVEVPPQPATAGAVDQRGGLPDTVS